MDKPWIDVTVAAVQQTTPAIKTFTLVPQEGGTLPPFTPGAHVDTHLTIDGATWLRSYSLCGDPLDTSHYQISIRRQERPESATHHWHTRVEKGTGLRIGLPVNRFGLSFSAKRHLFIAGGIGITPMLPMLSRLERTKAEFVLHYAARSAADCAFYEDLQRQYPGRIHFYFSAEGKRLGPEVLENQRIGTHVYICGPETMQRAFIDAAAGYGYPKSHIHFERFARLRSDKDQPFEVVLHRQQRSVCVGAEESVLEALWRVGVHIPSSCRAGGCGTCLVRVLSGEVEHRDFYLDEEDIAEGAILTCVSRALSRRLVLDL